MPAEEVLGRLATSLAGLAEDEATRRAAACGPNSLRPLAPVSPARILINQIGGAVPWILAAVAAVSWAMGDLLESAAVAVVLLLHVALGFATEWRAHRAMRLLGNLQPRRAVVRRGGRDRPLDAAQLVPGDLMVLDAGDTVAADGRLLSGAELRLIEAPLTGESMPADKSPAAVRTDAPLAERSSMVYNGTLVAAGHGLAVVTAIGGGTEVGRIAGLVEAVEVGKTPLERRIERVGRSLIGWTFALAAVAAAVGVWRGLPLLPMLQLGLALAIAAIPEGLPVVATVVLAVGMHRMAQQRALVRRLPSVETLGSVTVLCTDKTGTLTAGEMTVTRLHVGETDVEVEGRGYVPSGGFAMGGAAVPPTVLSGLIAALEVGVLANRAQLGSGARPGTGDPTELALLVAAAKAGMHRPALLERWPEVGALPFTSERRWMASFHRTGGGRTVVCAKGAPAPLLACCSRWLAPEGPRPLDDAIRRRLLAVNDRLAGEGLRVLALARGEAPSGCPLDETALRDLVWLAAVGIEDPEVPGMEATIADLQAAGIRVVMLTGDQVLTAAAVARRLGLLESGGEVLEGRQLAELSGDALASRLRHVAVIGRLAPVDKLRIVEALQHAGETVAMIGDGVNDGPALRRADVGIALGVRGTDIAKETASIVLADDRLSTVVMAVARGRVTHANVEKALAYLFTCNLAEVLVILATFFASHTLLVPLQILWLNLVTDVFPALGLAMEPPEPDVMRRGPRSPAEGLFPRRRLLQIGCGATGLAGATVLAYLAARRLGEPEAAATTAAFLTLGLGQLFQVLDTRSDRRQLFTRRIWSNRWLWAALLASVALLAVIVLTPPLARVFGTSPPSAPVALLSAALAFLPAALAQMAKPSSVLPSTPSRR
jgi:Ca2+-transporting ATPase